ncbi:MAG: class III signal peptide-containing protein [Candidatus Micrarchaeota archaeon]
MIKKGQVSTEYLVILAVVLVIALVVVYLVGGFSGLGAGSVETQSKNYWGATAPFAIKAFKASGTALDLEIQNNDLDRLVITGISVDGASIYSGNTSFTSGEAKIMTGVLPAACGAAGTPFTYDDVVITYNKGSLTGLAQAGTKPLVGKCS